MPLFIDSGTQAEQLRDFTEAMATGRSVVVTHDQWSDPLRRAAAEDLARARAAEGSRFLSRGKLVLFTSGSAGRPRPVIRSQQSWLDLVDPFDAAMGVDQDEVVWVPGSFAAALNLYGAWHARSRGHEVVLGYRAHPAKLGRVSVAYVVPGMVNSVLDAHARHMLPRLRTVITGGALVDPEMTAEARAQGVTLYELYGSAELGSVAHRVQDGFAPLGGVEVDVRDGELWVRSPYLSEGYLTDDPTGGLRLADGWATVGDRAAWADDGRTIFHLLGRGDVLNPQAGSGLTVGEVEARLREVHGLHEVVVTTVPGAHGHPEVVAVLTGGDEPDWSQFTAAAATIPPKERPVLWARAAVTPRLPNGGIDRSVIQAALYDGSLAAERLAL